MTVRALRCACVVSLSVLWLLATSTAGEASKRRLLNRSIYVPVHFRLCEHLKWAVLYVGDQAVAQLPADQIFIFTYYPDLNRLEPEVTRAHVEGVDLGGHPVVARLAISPKAIAAVTKIIDLDMEKQLKKLSYKIDVRYPKVRLRIACKKCGEGDKAALALNEEATGSPESETPLQRAANEHSDVRY